MTSRAAIVVAALLVVTRATAGPVAVGSTLAGFTAEDQHGAPATVDASVRLLVVSRDMDGGDVVKQALAGTSQTFLDERRVVYVADISGMPAMISKLFALPKMRERPYRVLLDRDGSLTRDLPREKGRATVVYIDALRVTRIDEVGSADELRSTLDQLPVARGAGT